MSISVRCRCDRVFKVGDGLAGRKARCPVCKTLLVIPNLQRPPAATPARPARGGWVWLIAAFFVLAAVGGLATVLFVLSFGVSQTSTSHASAPPPPATIPERPDPQLDPARPDQNKIVAPSATADPNPPQGELSAIDRLNRHRSLAGLSPVRLDPELSTGCQAHAEYLVKNLKSFGRPGFRIDQEDESAPGFSAEGRAAAKAAFCGLHSTDPGRFVDQWMASLFFRLVLLDPELQRVGWGTARDTKQGWFGVLDVMRGRGAGEVIVYPASGQTEVPLVFPGNEIPDPIPEATTKRAGYPITVTFPRDQTVVQVAVQLLDPQGKAIDAWLSTPERPAQQADQQLNSVCLIAKEPLQPKTTYTVDVRARVHSHEWSRRWSFTTGSGERLAKDARTVVECVDIHRKAAGLGAVALDAGLSKGCQAHADYLVKNSGHPKTEGLGAHEESPDLPGFSLEGKRAGKAADISFGIDPLASVDGYMSTFFHRIPILDPDLRRVGLGIAKDPKQGWVVVLDVQTGRGGHHPTLYPAEGQTQVPVAYQPGEVPDPIPESKDKRDGYPITVVFPRTALVEDASGLLTDESGKEVSCWFSSPKQTAHPDYQRQALALIPKEPLQLASRYQAVFSAKVDGEPWKKAWSFATRNP